MPILKLSNQFLGRLAAHFHRLRYIDISTIPRVMERVVNVPGTVSGRLRSSAPHMRSVRMNDMIRQRHLRRDKVIHVNHLHVRRIRYRTTSDYWGFLPDVINRLKCNLCKNL